MAVKPRLWTRGFILDTLVNFLIYIIYYMLVVIIASEAIHSLYATVSEAEPGGRHLRPGHPGGKAFSRKIR